MLRGIHHAAAIVLLDYLGKTIETMPLRNGNQVIQVLGVPRITEYLSQAVVANSTNVVKFKLNNLQDSCQWLVVGILCKCCNVVDGHVSSQSPRACGKVVG